MNGTTLRLAATRANAALLITPSSRLDDNEEVEEEVDEDDAAPWDDRCLRAWRGDVLVHVGEWAATSVHDDDDDDDDEGGNDADADDLENVIGAGATSESWPRGTRSVSRPHGVTTSAAFQARVARDFERVAVVAVPCWPGRRDDLTIWKRR